MAEWLPPQAPDGQPPPRFDREPERPVAPTPPEPPRPIFVPSSPSSARPNSIAIAGLVLGIAGVGLLLLSLGLGFFFSLPCSIAAWLLCARARARIGAGQEEGGAGQAKAGYVLGVAGVILGVVAMAVWIALISSGFSVEEFREDLERELERRRNRDSVESRLAELRAGAMAMLGR